METEVEDSDEIIVGDAGIAFVLVIAAGLCTALGGAAVYSERLVQLSSKPVLAAGLGFAAGVMLDASFLDIFPKSSDAFEAHGEEPAYAYLLASLCLFFGMALLYVLVCFAHMLDPDESHHSSQNADPQLSYTIPKDSGTQVDSCHSQNEASQPRSCTIGAGESSIGKQPVDVDSAPSSSGLQSGSDITDSSGVQLPMKPECEQQGHDQSSMPRVFDDGDLAAASPRPVAEKQLKRMGLKTAAAIAIHNAPEGLATFVAYIADPTVGVTLAIAIAFHNIPEGLCVALPIYYSTGNRHKGFLLSFLSGVTEPIGALVGWIIILATGKDVNQLVYGILFGVVAGMMIMIAFLELLPTAHRYDPQDRVVTKSVVCGMIVMQTSLVLLQF